MDATVEGPLDLEPVHGSIEVFLDLSGEAVDLIDKQYVAISQIRQNTRKVTRALYSWACGYTNIFAHFISDNRRHCCFTQPRRPVQQYVVDWFFALLRCVNR